MATSGVGPNQFQGSQLPDEVENQGNNQQATNTQNSEQNALSGQASSNVAQNQGTGQQQSSSDAQASTAAAAGANQTNQQNFAAGQATEAAAEASNQNENTLALESSEAKALDSEVKSGLGTFQ